MARITKLEPKIPVIRRQKKVAAYARVSMETERLQHSLSAQVSFYSELIQKNPEWVYAGVYADEGISGTGTTKRHGFQEMIADAEAGKIDIILTKSISRFARNTVDLLETVRHLKDLGVEVRFEKENINSLDGDGEVMLSILASFAQEESRSISENLKWAVRKKMESGRPFVRARIYGYRWEGDELVIEPNEAKIVKRIFQNFLDGKSRQETERELEAEGIRSIYGKVMRDASIRNILTNITYTGNMILQKVYTVDPISKKRLVNKGELPQYYVTDSHEAIIDKETFDYVQQEMERRRELGPFANKSLNTSCFTQKIKCPYCGCNYVRTQRKNRGDGKVYWNCGSKQKKGSNCPIPGTLPEEELKIQLARILGIKEFDESQFMEQVDYITVPEHLEIDIHLKDGRIIPRTCDSDLCKDRWTPEHREHAYKERQKRKERIKTCFTSKIRCGCCGKYYTAVTQRGPLISDEESKHYRCKTKGCTHGASLRDDALRKFTADIMGTKNFDEDKFLSRIVEIVVNDQDLTYRLKDGTEIRKRWEKPKKKCRQHTEKELEQMSTAMKEFWADPEKRKSMGEKISKIRRERGENWQKQ